MEGGRGDVQNSWEVGGMIYKRTFTNHPSHLPWALLQTTKVGPLGLYIFCNNRSIVIDQSIFIDTQFSSNTNITYKQQSSNTWGKKKPQWRLEAKPSQTNVWVGAI
jgi:hypothetical protein